jgi:hypothetical protein
MWRGWPALPASKLATAAVLTAEVAPHPVLAGRRGVVLFDREITHIGGEIARQRRQVTGVRDLVTLSRGNQARLGAVAALARAALTHVTAERVRNGIDTRREIAIAGSLIAIRRQLVAIGARLIAVSARLIAVRERLIAVGKRLLIHTTGHRDTRPGFLNRSVRFIGTIA